MVLLSSCHEIDQLFSNTTFNLNCNMCTTSGLNTAGHRCTIVDGPLHYSTEPSDAASTHHSFTIIWYLANWSFNQSSHHIVPAIGPSMLSWWTS